MAQESSTKPHRPAYYSRRPQAETIAGWWDPLKRLCIICGAIETAHEADGQRMRVTFEQTANSECWQ